MSDFDFESYETGINAMVNVWGHHRGIDSRSYKRMRQLADEQLERVRKGIEDVSPKVGK